ncbi:ROK family transcriptional regulator [Nocardia brasiliensis]|uniref:ROK family protein n=1 Tax=Nocardia brasiliensis (strain ATCC 700358 / HUJEG-1) TaxID=1133849 RepID=K0EMS2_NOCB7|nr:ROK family transcriptional regulator [Nocardia brasiliensis]AFU00908.1 ROK family protein [Nocardia brasiliensis ATCC 700358]OCF84138.1 transcriptional regulator [Nocardia brasiliensis]
MYQLTARDIRRRNRFGVLQAVYAADGHISRQDIARATGLSFATVGNMIAELLDVGVLVELGHDAPGVGRPRARLAINPDRGLLVGVDIAETAIHFDLFDLAMTALRAVEIPVDPAATEPHDVAALIIRGIRELTAGDADKVLGAGLSVPGLVEPEGGISVFSPYWHWHDVPLKELLDDQLPHPLYLDNPLKASTAAHLWFGAGRDVDDLIVVTLRAGVGIGVVVDGMLYRGVSNSAGEWGHTNLVLDGRECRCGRTGCVEAYVGAPGIVRTLRELDPASPMLASDDAATIAAIAAAAGREDPVALAVIDRTGHYLGVAVANLVNLFNPRTMVFGDLVADHLGPPLLEVTRRVAAHHAMTDPFDAVTLQLSALPHNPASLGAATFALDGFLADRETFGSIAARRALRTSAT